MTAADAIAGAIAAACAEGGLDLTATCAAADYDAVVPAAYRLPDVGRFAADDIDTARVRSLSRPRALVVVVGNTRTMWPHVVRTAGPHPVDTHVARVVHGAVERALAAVEPRPRVEVRFAPEPPPRRVAMQRLAHVAGLAWLAPSHMCVHPVHGPWIGLRAAIVIDVEGPPPRPPPWTTSNAPCDCSRGCQPALERALAAGPPTSQAELRDRWKLWLAVRDACPVGRDARYGEHQIRYHYTGDRTALALD